MKGDIRARVIVVDGKVEGDLYATESVSIRATAKVKGNVFCAACRNHRRRVLPGQIEMQPSGAAVQNTARACVGGLGGTAGGHRGRADVGGRELAQEQLGVEPRRGWRLNPQCRWGPVVRPVMPTAPMRVPRFQALASFTSIALKWQYMLIRPRPWSMTPCCH